MRADVQIVIPSRKRSNQIIKALELFPSAVVWVHEKEADDYKLAAPLIKIRTHKRVDGIWAIRKEIILNTDAKIIVLLDDDITLVRYYAGDGSKPVNIKEPGHIEALIENTASIADDLGLELFAWSRDRMLQAFNPCRPFEIVYPCATAFGVIGKKCLPDEKFKTGGDIDLTMQALQNSRIVFVDKRYFFDNGQVGKGKGGLQGLRTSASENETSKMLSVKWGKYVYRGKSKCKSKMGGMAMSIRVERKNPLVSTK